MTAGTWLRATPRELFVMRPHPKPPATLLRHSMTRGGTRQLTRGAGAYHTSARRTDVTEDNDESHRVAERHGAGGRLPNRAGARRGRIRRHISRRRDRARPARSASKNISQAISLPATAASKPRRARKIAPATTTGASSASSKKLRRLRNSTITNIVKVYRYFRANNTAYMVLRFEEGKNLKAWLKGLGRAPRQKELEPSSRRCSMRWR